MSPGHVYLIDGATGASFAVPAPPTVYGVAFAPDGRYAYLGSAQRGTISRVDLAAQKIDKQVAAPRFLHHLVVSPGGKLFALATSSAYAVYDLPDLKARTDATHPAGVAPAMAQLSGNGVASLDGGWFVAPDAENPRHPPPDRSYVIARIVD
jgi:DNA-binding beta-propeller fold protein YncE